MLNIIAKSTPKDLIGLIAVFAAILAIAFTAVMYIRKKALDDSEDGSTGGMFTLSELRELHKNGSISDEEFEKAKAAIIGSVKAELDAGDSETDQQ